MRRGSDRGLSPAHTLASYPQPSSIDWGWSPNLVAWEMWNEVVNIAGLDTKSGKVIGTDSQPVRPLRHFGYGIQLQLPEFQASPLIVVICKSSSASRILN